MDSTVSSKYFATALMPLPHIADSELSFSSTSIFLIPILLGNNTKPLSIFEVCICLTKSSLFSSNSFLSQSKIIKLLCVASYGFIFIMFPLLYYLITVVSDILTINFLQQKCHLQAYINNLKIY